MGRGWVALFAWSLGCSAEAAEPPSSAEPPATEPEPEPATELEMPALEMPALALTDRPLEFARDPVVNVEPSWERPAHDPGELPRWIRHRPIRGETIEELGIRYGVRPEKIRGWNEMGVDDQPHPLRPKRLKIFARGYPIPREQLNVVAVVGDTWGQIARRHGVDLRLLRQWNVGQIGRSLEPGESVTVWIEPVVYASILHEPPRDLRAASIRAGAHGVGTPQAGMLVAGVQIPPGDGYELRFPNSAWGTTWAVRNTVAALDHFSEHSDYPHPLRVGTMSRERGGEIGHHNSHQSGRDLDIRLPLRREVPQGLDPTPRRVDWLATWALIQAFAWTSEVRVVFLDYGSQRRVYKAAEAAGASPEALASLIQFPGGSKASHGLVRHASGHEGHIHVRFECGPDEPLCAD